MLPKVFKQFVTNSSMCFVSQTSPWNSLTFPLNELVSFSSSDMRISEMSVAAGAGPYDTPNAFGDVGDDTIEMLGYKRVKKNKKF
jgi:hypothetical protein